MSQLFTQLQLGPVTLANRTVIAPMCMYSADEGKASDWHKLHLGQLALSGAGLLIIEATAVNPVGRITYADLGLWNDATEQALAETLKTIRPYSNMPIAIQLAHAGRKASTKKSWHGGGAITADEEKGWQTIAPSAISYNDDLPVPREMTQVDIQELINDFTESAKRSARLGFEVIEIHAAHGYLLHQFLSPLSNQRSDQYGGSLQNRMRLLLEIFQSVRDVFPKDKAVGVRISATDWVECGWDLTQSIELAKALEALGCDFIHVSSAGTSPLQKIPVAPDFQVPLAERIKQAVTIPVIAVGLITEPEQAEAIISQGKADAIALARGILYNPHWVWHAADKLNAKVEVPPQYFRCAPMGSEAHLKLGNTKEHG